MGCVGGWWHTETMPGEQWQQPTNIQNRRLYSKSTEARYRASCGCEIVMRPGDPPIRAWECEHGNYMRAVDPPTGDEILAYQKWLRSPEADEYFAGMSDTFDSWST